MLYNLTLKLNYAKRIAQRVCQRVKGTHGCVQARQARDYDAIVLKPDTIGRNSPTIAQCVPDEVIGLHDWHPNLLMM